MMFIKISDAYHNSHIVNTNAIASISQTEIVFTHAHLPIIHIDVLTFIKISDALDNKNLL